MMFLLGVLAALVAVVVLGFLAYLYFIAKGGGTILPW